jgi:cold shock CspA family protein
MGRVKWFSDHLGYGFTCIDESELQGTDIFLQSIGCSKTLARVSMCRFT